jgi:hypothetical protein
MCCAFHLQVLLAGTFWGSSICARTCCGCSCAPSLCVWGIVGHDVVEMFFSNFFHFLTVHSFSCEVLDALRWFEMVWDLMVYCRHVWKSEFVSPVMLFCDVLWKQDGFSMVYFSWCSVMMYDVVLCLCSISCIFILAEEQVLASVPENNVPAAAVTFPAVSFTLLTLPTIWSV